MTYEWKNYNYPVSANDVGALIEKIEKKEGAVTAENVLDAARSKKSIIHDLFEWDDAVAGEKYRLSQAGRIIRALAIVKEDPKENLPAVTRAFVNVGTRTDGKFINVSLAMSQDETREIVLKHALDELCVFQNKYKGLKELETIFADIDQLKLNL